MALAARRRVGQPAQHEVHDVVRQVVLAAADEDLAARHAQAAVGLRLGARAQLPEVAAGLRLGQRHRSQSLAGDDVGQPARLELVACMRLQRLVGTVQQVGVHRPAVVAGVEHLARRGVDQQRQALAAPLRRTRQRRPAAVDIGAVGSGEARRRAHGAVGVARAALAVAARVQRQQHLAREARGLVEHGLRRRQVEIGERGAALPRRRCIEHALDHEAHLAQGGDVVVAHDV